MFSLYNTNSEKAGFRLQYMEVLNWGTFDKKIFRINPQGNNSLLTGANASGKSTFVDALLTLLVPAKNDRFYNQSSGVAKKGDRTEETYVLGHYGNIQEEGKTSTSTQKLREKDKTYSILLASFGNTDKKNITLFQLRWFTNGELKRMFGIAHVPLTIQHDFSQFDNWRKTLDKKYNENSPKKKIEFFDSSGKYAERIVSLFGMRSLKALSLFSQIVGVKVLDDLDEFIKTKMLEEYEENGENSEEVYTALRDVFANLTNAKTDIEKAKEQIAQLTPIDNIANKLSDLKTELTQLQQAKEMSVYWFAKKYIELSEQELQKNQDKLETFQADLQELLSKEEALKGEERELSLSIERDETGSKIKELEKEIKQLEKSRDLRKSKLEDYNKIAQFIKLSTNPSQETFETNREKAKERKINTEKEIESENENLRKFKNEQDNLTFQIEEIVKTIQTLQKNKNNIAGRTAEIREEILTHLEATKEDIPFIGELLKVQEEENEWEFSVEKILHSFALQLIIPEKYYTKLNQYVNKTNLKGKITYQRYKGDEPSTNVNYQNAPKNALLRKLAFKPKSIYADWLENAIAKQYNYACVKDLKEFDLYDEKAITKEGLIKFGKGRHEKDDRAHIISKENYVLGWDNKEKINTLKNELYNLQELQNENKKAIANTQSKIKNLAEVKDKCYDIFSKYEKYDDIDWQTYAQQVQEKTTQKTDLEKTNDRLKVLQSQLKKVKDDLKNLTEIDIKNKNREIFSLENRKEIISKEIKQSQLLITNMDYTNTEGFENFEVLGVDYENLKSMQIQFEQEVLRKITALENSKRKNEDEVKLKINAFKHPSEAITAKFVDWRADVQRFPESTHLEFISEYQAFLQKLTDDNLPKFEKKFNEYLQETITHKVGNFRMFFKNWTDAIAENIQLLNDSLKEIDFRNKDFKTYIQMIQSNRVSEDVKEFRDLLENAIANIHEMESTVDGRKTHFEQNIEPLIKKLEKEDWRKRVMEVRNWFNYKAEEFYKETNAKYKTYENMGQLSGGEKAQLTYTILGSAIAYQFGLTKGEAQTHAFRFIAIDEAFKAQDEDKAKYLITLCKQLHLQLLVVTPSDNIHIVENDISYVHFVERKEEKYSWLYDMPIEQFIAERKGFLNQANN